MESELKVSQKGPPDDHLKAVIICADDYGVDSNVDAAIVELARANRLTATSVLVDADISTDSIAELESVDIDVGLHLNFTEALGSVAQEKVMSLSQLIVRAHMGLLSRSWVRSNIERQLNRFEGLFDRLPDYVDGHLHIHQLPMIREELVDLLTRYQLPSGFWVRDTRAGSMADGTWSDRFKSWVIGHLGMARLAHRVQQAQLATNQGFFGVYDFTRGHRPFMQMMDSWLSHADPGALVMTHPSRQPLNDDPIGQARVAEYEGLGSEAFLNLLQARGVRLARASQTLSSLP
jgi:predicted glycoside hydrolase/deacetylase ChbG (UPF0249 family)